MLHYQNNVMCSAFKIKNTTQKHNTMDIITEKITIRKYMTNFFFF